MVEKKREKTTKNIKYLRYFYKKYSFFAIVEFYVIYKIQNFA